ncbi:MAG: YcaO-like family protein [Deltaproteobacteria bacterium]|nr:YcaO-like family protein [Deltaproteobacteria bacterium]
MNQKYAFPPVNYRDKAYRSPKLDPEKNSHRYPIQETLKRLKPIMQRIGITRISNVTGLDRIGIPCVNAIRPDLDGFSVAHGKGLTLDAAMASAVMESTERYYGMEVDLPSHTASYSDLGREYNCASFEKIASSKNSLFHKELPVKWVMGWDLVHEQEAAVPLELVSLRRNFKSSELYSFQASSNGLAAGLDFLDAVTQALLEVIERDAVTCHQLAAESDGSSMFPMKSVDISTIPYEAVKQLISGIETVDIKVMLYDCTLDTQVPCYNCYLLDRAQPKFGICHGMGASLSPATAMVRAVTEAALARAVLESGVRESFFRDQLVVRKMFDCGNILESMENGGFSVDASNLKSEITASFEGDIHICIRKLRNVGIDQVIVFDISPAVSDFHVVRVVVPGLEGYMLPHYRPGERGIRYIQGGEI